MKKIYPLLTIILLFVLSKSCISDYIKGGDNQAILNYEKMISDHSVTEAELSPEYTETTIKIKGVPVSKMYNFQYEFYLDGVAYQGKASFKNIPESNSVDVYYLKTNPDFSCVDPTEKLETEKEKNHSKKDLYWGIGWGVFCLLTLIGFITELVQTRKKTKEE